MPTKLSPPVSLKGGASLSAAEFSRFYAKNAGLKMNLNEKRSLGEARFAAVRINFFKYEKICFENLQSGLVLSRVVFIARLDECEQNN